MQLKEVHLRLFKQSLITQKENIVEFLKLMPDDKFNTDQIQPENMMLILFSLNEMANKIRGNIAKLLKDKVTPAEELNILYTSYRDKLNILDEMINLFDPEDNKA